MTHPIRNAAYALLVSLLCISLAAQAQQRTNDDSAYPNKPIRVIIASALGGGTDLTSRLIMGKVGEKWNRPFVLDARSGASGTIGVDLVVKAPSDGYTLLAAPMSALATVPLINKVQYDAQKDLVPIAQFISQPYVLAVTAALPVTSVRDLIALAKSKPGVLNYASTGIGTSVHLATELFKSMAGINIVNISYKGTGETTIALMGGQVDILFGGSPAVAPHAKTGKLKLLAVTSLKRSPFLPDLPTIAEAGVPGFEVVGWYGLLGPKGTPSAVVLALNRDINEALNTPALRDKFAEDGAEVTPGTPAQFQDVIAREIAKWTKLLKESNLKL